MVSITKKTIKTDKVYKKFTICAAKGTAVRDIRVFNRVSITAVMYSDNSRAVVLPHLTLPCDVDRTVLHVVQSR
jgi:hypothetical protein